MSSEEDLKIYQKSLQTDIDTIKSQLRVKENELQKVNSDLRVMELEFIGYDMFGLDKMRSNCRSGEVRHYCYGDVRYGKYDNDDQKRILKTIKCYVCKSDNHTTQNCPYIDTLEKLSIHVSGMNH